MAGRKFSVLLVAIAMAVVVAPVAAPAPALAAEPAEELPLGWDEASGIYVMIFPVDGEARYSNTFGACRSGCSRRHEGIDMMAAKMTPIVAVAAGTVGWMHNEQGGKCCAMSLNHDDGWRTWYIHMNNDTPGTDDGKGWGFAPGIAPGVHVEAGQHIGWVGDSGNAENSGSHLHIELHRPDGTKINPYDHLRAAEPEPEPDPGPEPGAGSPVVVSYRIDDGPSHDGTGNDSKGNNDGLAQCGETIELYVTITNDGESTLTGLRGALAESDPYLKLLYNTAASYPNLKIGASAENPRDWDLRIAADTPNGHEFDFTVTYTADNGGSWKRHVTIPITCGS